jgi:hypothetical protein
VEKQAGQKGVYGNPNAVPVTQVSATTASAPIAAQASTGCKKGYLWPFVRDTGDCLTEVEKQAGQKGVYGNPNAVPVTQVSATTASAPIAASASAPSAAPASAPQSAPTTVSQTSSAPACHKGWLWPFVRDPGDCPTDTEKGKAN